MGQKAGTVAAVEAVAARTDVRASLAWAARAEAWLAAETARVTEIPAPTFDEGRRAAYVAERFAAEGLTNVQVRADGNVYGTLTGGASDSALALFVHLDTVFGANVPIAVQRRNGRLYAPGVGDNSAGLAGVIGLLAALRAGGVVPCRTLHIVATVGEEGLGDLCGARAATDTLGNAMMVVAVEGSFLGRLSHTAVGSRRWRIGARADGGHSWHDFGNPSAVHTLMRVGANITRLAVPTEPRTTLNIGEVHGGTGVNVIAEHAELLLDMRSIDAEALDRLSAHVRETLGPAMEPGVHVSVQEVGDRPAGRLASSHPLVRTCAAVLTHMGMNPVAAAASTDANIPLSLGIPALTLGVTRGGGAHTLGEWVETAPMVRGVHQLVLVVAALTDPAITPCASGR